MHNSILASILQPLLIAQLYSYLGSQISPGHGLLTAKYIKINITDNINMIMASDSEA